MKTMIKMNAAKRCTAALALTLFLATALRAQKTDYSGTWTRNDAKCTMSETISLNSIPVQVQVTQLKNGIEITRISKNRQGETSTYSETLSLDSTLSSSVAIRPNVNKQSAMKWNDDHKGLQETAQYADDKGNPLQK